jgi:hypothetical protein
MRNELSPKIYIYVWYMIRIIISLPESLGIKDFSSFFSFFFLIRNGERPPGLAVKFSMGFFVGNCSKQEAFF